MTKAEQERFENFIQDLLQARDLAYKEINIANEFGLGHWEVKHSVFLEHLFDPNRKQYCLKADQSGSKAYFLRLFFAALEKYTGKGKNKRKKSNSDILASGSGTGQAVTAADIEALGRANDLQVKREAPVVAIEALGRANDLQVKKETPDEDDKGRIDILLISEQEQIVFVIENKVLSTTHDDQLRKYEEYYQGQEWKKKVFVYLTPEGDIPQNEDGTEAVNWCTFDYAVLRDVVEEFKNSVALNTAMSITELKGKLKNKFIYALEDYMGNIDTEVLKKAGGEANDVYAKLLDQYQDLVEGLVGFYNGARPLVIADYCREVLNAEFVGGSRYWFYTETMKEFFQRHNEEIENKCFIVCQGTTSKNAKSMEIWLQLNVANGKPLSPAQQLIRNNPQFKVLQKGYKSTAIQNYRVITTANLFLEIGDMTEPDGTYKPFDEVRPVIDRKLQPFLNLLTEFENTLKTL